MSLGLAVVTPDSSSRENGDRQENRDSRREVFCWNAKCRVAQILVIEMNLGASRAGFARGVFDFCFAGKLNRINLYQTKLPFFVEPETAPYLLPSILRQSAFDWIFMHVLQLLSHLVLEGGPPLSPARGAAPFVIFNGVYLPWQVYPP